MSGAIKKEDLFLPPVPVIGDYPVVCNIRALRLQTNQSLEELGAKVELPKQAIMDLENGRAIPKLTTAMKLADVFGIKIDDLYMKSGKWSPSTAKRAPAPVMKAGMTRSPFGVSQPRILK